MTHSCVTLFQKSVSLAAKYWVWGEPMKESHITAKILISPPKT
eukprot:CAMPEP_0179435182 /NCGR_PEP_ID=MMETSP0799-20121207/19348_1 /TAXON_ID=46947 /ORGANISM="Geminigera cryophila, Strain CCMP2564" /LENGTH=42 /DNA_ID= /DNA_START= /DNA_END= /DNA_ORIENTATION=